MNGSDDQQMAALAVQPGRAHSLHARRVPRPTLDAIPGGRGVLVAVLQVGVDGTDREVIEARYGAAPPGDEYLVLGHENFGRIEAVGASVTAFRPGDLVVSTVRRPGTSLYDQIGMQDFTTDEVASERGINLLHGFLSEWYAEDEQFLVSVPPMLAPVAVLTEPFSVSKKGIAQAFEIQRRLRIWRPTRACVIGAGTIGLLAALALRLRGFETVVYSRRRAPYLNSELAEALGAQYVSSSDVKLQDVAAEDGPFDLIFEASGYSPLAFDAALALRPNGVLILSGVTGGERRIEVDADAINRTLVLGNRVIVGTVNASRADFDAALRDMLQAQTLHPGWLRRLLTTPIHGLSDPDAVWHHLTADDEAIKVYVVVAS